MYNISIRGLRLLLPSSKPKEPPLNTFHADLFSWGLISCLKCQHRFPRIINNRELLIPTTPEYKTSYWRRSLSKKMRRNTCALLNTCLKQQLILQMGLCLSFSLIQGAVSLAYLSYTSGRIYANFLAQL